MKSITRLRPSPAIVISLLALFLSLGGVSYGVATGYIDSRELKNNTVSTRDLRNNDIRTKDLRNNEIRGLDIRNSTVQGRDVALATLTGEDIRESTLAKVPSATRADSAAAVDGLRVIPATPVPAGRRGHRRSSPTVRSLVSGGMPRRYGRPARRGAGAVDRGRIERGRRGGLLRQPRSRAQVVAAVTSAGPRVIESSPLVASTPTTRVALSGVVALIADGAGSGSCRFDGHVAVSGVAPPVP